MTQKTILIIILFSLFSTQAFSQFFGGENTDIVTAQTIDKQENIYLTGFTKNYTQNGSDDVFVLKINLKNSTLEYKTYGDKFHDRAYDIEVIEDNIFVSGESNSGFGQKYGRENAFLLKLDNNLKPLKQYSPYFYHRDAILKTKELFDGNLLSVGYSRSFNTGINSIGDFFVLKTNQDLDTIWHKAFNQIGNDYCFDLYENVNNDIILLGVSGGFFNSNQADYRFSHDADILFISINANGKQINRYSWGGTSHDFAKQIIESPNNDGYFIIGSTQSFGNGNFDILLLKVDYNFNEIWHKTFGDISTDYGESISFSSFDNSLYITGTETNTTTNLPELTLLQTDLNGELLNKKNISIDKYTFGKNLNITDDGYCIISGNCGQSLDNFNFFALKYSFTEDETIFLINNVLINVYPNPVAIGQDITFEIINKNEQFSFSNLYIQIFDISGKIVLRKPFSENKFFLNTSTLEQGLYLYSIILYNRLAYVGKFIVD